MKRMTAILLITALVLCLAACGKASSQSAAAASSAEASASAASSAVSGTGESEPAPAVVGGWTLNADITPAALPEKVQTAFDKATEKLLGNNLVPIALIGQQVVAGMNYAILCESTLVTKEPVVSYQVAIIYADLQGDAEVTNITEFNLGDYTQGDGAENTGEVLPGGWAVPEDYTVVTLPDEVQSAFDAALEGFVGNNLEPMAYLGSQVVSGVNYAVLCHSSLVTKEPVNSIQVVTIYKDLQGNASITNICTLDPADYNQ